MGRRKRTARPRRCPTASGTTTPRRNGLSSTLTDAMCIYVLYMYVYIYMCVYIYICLQLYLVARFLSHIAISVSIFIILRFSSFLHVYTYIYIYVCMYIKVCIYGGFISLCIFSIIQEEI